MGSKVIDWLYWFSLWGLVLVFSAGMCGLLLVAYGLLGWLTVPAALFLFGPPTVAYILEDR